MSGHGQDAGAMRTTLSHVRVDRMSQTIEHKSYSPKSPVDHICLPEGTKKRARNALRAGALSSAPVCLAAEGNAELFHPISEGAGFDTQNPCST